MGRETNISWTDSTFNPWLGCEKVSAGCKNCYAENDTPIRVHRGKGLELWGGGAARVVTGADNWKKPARWNREAQAAGRRHRVFCASLADVFEGRRDLDAPRARLFALIEQTPWLDWQLVTKRPENMMRLAPAAWANRWPLNVWAGCTVENQRAAAERIPHLLRIPAVVRFLSMEPLIEAVDLDPPTCPSCGSHDAVTGSDGATLFCREHVDEMAFGAWLDACASAKQAGINWVICGGESGPKARPFDLAWAREIVTQCREAGVSCFVKQMGAQPIDSADRDIMCNGTVHYVRPADHPMIAEAGARPGYSTRPHRVMLRDGHGGDPSEWPSDLRVREFPTVTP